MPSPTNYSGLKYKISLFFSLLILPFAWYFSIRGIFLNRPQVAQISATVVEIYQAGDGDTLDVEFLNGKRINRVSLSLRRQDLSKYPPGQSVIIVRDDSALARYDYCLLNNYERRQLQEKITLWVGAIAPIGLLYWVWKRWPRPNQ